MDILVCNKGSDFAGWGAKWKAKSSTTRDIVMTTQSGTADKLRVQIVRAIRTAAKKASNGRLIIAVGHGGAHHKDPGVGMVDLAGRKAFRIQREHLNYSRDDRKSDRKIVSGLKSKAPKCAPRSRLRRMTSNQLSWCNAKNKLDIREKFDQIGKILKANNVKSVVFLACRVGKAQAFVNRIGALWGVKITGYERRIAIGKDSHDKWRVYFFGDKEGSGSNVERARTELPPKGQSYTSGQQKYQPGQTIPRIQSRNHI